MRELGRVLKASRKAQGLRQDDLGAYAGLSHVFVMQVERGKETAHIGKVLALLEQVGVRVQLDVPDSVADEVLKALANSEEVGRSENGGS
jgi:transcriptional regulator with XRE-family HTH domain